MAGAPRAVRPASLGILGRHLLVYFLVNAFLVVIWALTDVHGFFWPVFPIVGWGIGVVMNAWDVFRNEELGEEQIRREVERLRRQG
jgi:hypothetical protein